MEYLIKNRPSSAETPYKILSETLYRLQRRKALTAALAAVAGLMIALSVLLCFFGIARVRGTSMEPTLYADDLVILRRHTRDYGRGDVVIYKAGADTNNVKRIVAVAGDVVDIDAQGRLTVNGALSGGEGGDDPAFSRSGGVTYPYTVGEDAVFVLGDHRTSSVDSRDVGAIRTGDIIGEPVWVVRHINSD